MNPALVRQAVGDVQAQWLVIGILEQEGGGTEPLGIAAVDPLLKRLADDKEITGAVGELTTLHEVAGVKARSVLLVGLGRREKLDAQAAFTAGFSASKRLSGKPRESVAVVPPAIPFPTLAASALIEGLVVGAHGPGLRKSESSRHPFGSLAVVIGADPEAAFEREWTSACGRGRIVGQAVNFARGMANLPPGDKTPKVLAEAFQTEAIAAGMTAEIWDEARIREEQFGGLLGVAAGSDEPPRFVVLDYRPHTNGPTLALVGKGVTFDSGGLCLKPAASMEDMKCDMTGAAVVAAAMAAIARLKLPIQITGYLPITENMTGGKAMRMGDVLTHRGGKTVEVLNTDAEGRLILADALAYAAEHKPAKILDLATLTGACMVALGPKVAGLFSNDDGFRDQVAAASRLTGERVWPMPLDDDYKEQLKSHVADMKNVGGKWAGAITAAKFLQQFVGVTPWVHLDIAGPSWADSDSPTRDAGATGCFVRTLVALVERAAGEVSDSR